MNEKQAKAKLKSFMKNRILTFSIRNYESGEWIAECNEIPGIMTGGMGNDITTLDSLIRDAILTAAGVDTQYTSLLHFVGYRVSEYYLQDVIRKAEYALP